MPYLAGSGIQCINIILVAADLFLPNAVKMKTLAQPIRDFDRNCDQTPKFTCHEIFYRIQASRHTAAGYRLLLFRYPRNRTTAVPLPRPLPASRREGP